jgi:D-lactate dehydrogenase (quinone)
LLRLLDGRGAEYPAEHNVGNLYEAKRPLREFYESLDPTNSLNPGIGKTSRQKRVVGTATIRPT